MPERFPTPDGGDYTFIDGKYTYYDIADGTFGVPKTKEEMEEIMKRWSSYTYDIYYGTVLLCIFVLLIAFVSSLYTTDNALVKWIFGSLLGVSVFALFAPYLWNKVSKLI